MATNRSSLHRHRLGPPARPLFGWCAAAIAAWLVAWAAGSSTAAVLDPRGVQSETFSNGLRLIVASDADAPVIAVEVVVKAGSADDPEGKRGLAHLLEHVLWAGAGGGERDPRRRVEEAGGITNGGTLRDFTRFYATAPAGSLELAVGALGEVVVASTIDPAVVARERQVILEETAGRQEDPRAVLSDAAFAVVYGGSSPYGSPIGGDAASLGRADAASLGLFRDRWYVPNNMAVVVAGDVSFDAARAAVERAFGAMTPSPVPARDLTETGTGTETAGASPHLESRISNLAVPKAYVMAAFVGPEATDRLQVGATDLLATLLAHDPVGRLVVELRERRGIAAEVGIDFLTQRQRSLFGVWAVCDPDKVGEVESAIRGELARLAREPVPVAELATAKRLLASGYAFANETAADRASTLGFYEAIDSYRAASYYLSWVMDTTPQALMATAARYAGEPTWIILVPRGGGQ